VLRRSASPEPFAARALRFLRAIVVGSGATLVDFSIFTSCVRLIGVAPTSARLPALIAGACVQFVGNRSFTFRARAGKLARQLKLFIVAELLTLALNWCVFQLLIRKLTMLPAELVSFIGTGLVFLSLGYPLRRRVIFRLPEPPPG
jgi:putative flippase GtrA